MELTIERKFGLIACLCRTRITIISTDGAEIVTMRLWTGQAKTLSLPNQRCILKASTSIPLLHSIVNSAVCYGDRFDKIHAEIIPTDYNYLAGLIPGLAIVLPLFEYKITMRGEMTDE